MLVWAVIAVISVILFLLVGAVLEMHRSIEQLRRDAGVVDDPVGIKFTAERLPDEFELAADLASEQRSLLLVLSDSCGSCELIAESVMGELPRATWLVVTPRSVESGMAWLSRYNLSADRKAIVDVQRSIPESVGVTITPSVVRFRNGKVVAAHTLPSARRLKDELLWTDDDGPDRPAYVRYAEDSNRSNIP